MMIYSFLSQISNLYIDIDQGLQNGHSGEVDLTWKFYTQISGC